MSTTIATATEYDPGLEASGERADLLATSADNAEGTQIIAIYGKVALARASRSPTKLHDGSAG